LENFLTLLYLLAAKGNHMYAGYRYLDLTANTAAAITACTNTVQSGVPANAQSVLITVEDKSASKTSDDIGVRFRGDTVSPTATVGTPMNINEKLVYDQDISSLVFIDVDTDVRVHFEFFK
jgi:hypothetical protein